MDIVLHHTTLTGLPAAEEINKPRLLAGQQLLLAQLGELALQLAHSTSVVESWREVADFEHQVMTAITAAAIPTLLTALVWCSS